MKSSTSSKDGSVILKAFGQQMASTMPKTFSLLADVRRLSREYFERIHRCSSDGKAESSEPSALQARPARCAQDVLAQR